MNATPLRAKDARSKDIWAGLLMMALAILFGATAMGYPLGTARNLDSGAFPILLSGLLFCLGLAITLIGLVRGSGSIDDWTWRGVLLILGPPVFFGLFIRELGLIPCLALVAFVSSFASRLAKLPLSILLAILLTLFCVAVFIYGLGLPIPLIGRWLGGH